MKKNLLGVLAGLLLLSVLSCATKAHWAGVYTGVTPSTDGEEINVKITLNANETYKMERRIGKSNEIAAGAGKFTWNAIKDTIIIGGEGEGEPSTYYKLGEKALIHLVTEGNIISGEVASDYLLYKQK